MKGIQRFEPNLLGHDYVVADIHGCFDRLDALLKRAGFEPAVDRLFTPGDLVDRGPDSLAALEWLDRPWFFATAGNHEAMAMNFAAGRNHPFHYERNGGRWFIDLSDAEQHRIARRFAELPLAIELPVNGTRYGLVHAEVPGDDWSRLEDPDREAVNTALWARERIDGGSTAPVRGIDLVLVGHTPVPHLRALGNVLYLDTGAVFGHHMLLLDLHSGTGWADNPPATAAVPT